VVDFIGIMGINRRPNILHRHRLIIFEERDDV
jgi:hypothetical protein